MIPNTDPDTFTAQWRDTGGSELANTQSFINGLCALIGVAPPQGSRTDDAHNDYVFELRIPGSSRSAFRDDGDQRSDMMAISIPTSSRSVFRHDGDQMRGVLAM